MPVSLVHERRGGGLWVWGQTGMCRVAVRRWVALCCISFARVALHLPKKALGSPGDNDSYVIHLCRGCDQMMNEDTSSYSTSQTFKFKYAFWQRRMACQYESINLLKWFQEYRKLYTIWYHQAVRSTMYKRENDHLRQNSNGIDLLLDSYEIVVVG